MFCITRRCKISGWKLTIYVRGFSVECMLGGTEHPHQTKAEEDCSYRQRSRTPPSEYFLMSSYLVGGERHQRRRNKSSPPENMGGMMLYVEPCAKSLGHLLRTELKGLNSHTALPN